MWVCSMIMLNLIRLITLFNGAMITVAGHGATPDNKIDCLVNETIGFSDLKNVYQCRQPMKCCFEYSKPACCARKPSIQIIKEQLTLWGGLFAILFCLASIVYCRKKDLNFPACTALKMCMIRFCCGGGEGGSGGGSQTRSQPTIKLQQKTNTSSSLYSNYGQELNYHNSNNNSNHQSNNINHHHNSKNNQDVIIKQPTSIPITAVTTTSTKQQQQQQQWHRQTKVNPLPTEMQLKPKQLPSSQQQQQHHHHQQPRKTMADYSTFTNTNNNSNNGNNNNNNNNNYNNPNRTAINSGQDSHQPRIQMSQV